MIDLSLVPSVAARLMAAALRAAGNANSGNYGHAGRPGQVGGSAPSGVDAAISAAVTEMGDRQKDAVEHHIGIDLDTGERVFDMVGDSGGPEGALAQGLTNPTLDDLRPSAGVPDFALVADRRIADIHTHPGVSGGAFSEGDFGQLTWSHIDTMIVVDNDSIATLTKTPEFIAAQKEAWAGKGTPWYPRRAKDRYNEILDELTSGVDWTVEGALRDTNERLAKEMGVLLTVTSRARSLGGPGSGNYGHQGGKGGPGNPGGSDGDGGATVRLYRGDAKSLHPSLSYSDPGALFGAGIYLTDSKRIAGDYTAKGADVLFRYDGAKTNKDEVINTYIRRVLAPSVDEHGNKLSWPDPLPFSKGDGIRLMRLEQGRKLWDEMKDRVEVRRMADGTTVIRAREALGQTSQYNIPVSWVSKTIDAEKEISPKVAAALYATIRRESPRAADRLYDFATTKDEDGYVPSYRQVYTHPDFDDVFRNEATQVALRKNLKELGYKGIQYDGGVTMGGAKHAAYVFWDEQGLKKARALAELEVLGGPGSGNFGHSGRPGEVGGSGDGAGVATPAFRKWFGASQIVDAQGAPMVVYHGGRNVSSFKMPLFLSRHREHAQGYADERTGGENKLHSLYARVENPARNEDVDAAARAVGVMEYANDGRGADEWTPSHEWLSPGMIGREAVEKVIAELKSKGFDGAWVDGDFGMHDLREYDSIVVFDAHQVKAVDNKTFDSKNPLIALGGPGSGNYGHSGGIGGPGNPGGSGGSGGVLPVGAKVYRGSDVGGYNESSSFGGLVYVSLDPKSAEQWGKVREYKLTAQQRVLDLNDWNAVGAKKLVAQMTGESLSAMSRSDYDIAAGEVFIQGDPKVVAWLAKRGYSGMRLGDDVALLGKLDTYVEPRTLDGPRAAEFDPNQPRDEKGQWTSTGSITESSTLPPEFERLRRMAQPTLHGPLKTDEHRNQQARAEAQTNPLAHPMVVLGDVDNIGAHRYVAAYGQEFQPAPLPADIEKGKLGDCFKNASLMVMSNPDLTYAEGFAYTEKIPFGYWHAWGVTADGTVVDPTWNEPEKCKYFGVKYERLPYLKSMYKAKFYGRIGADFKTAEKTIETGGSALRALAFDPNQERDTRGRWTGPNAADDTPANFDFASQAGQFPAKGKPGVGHQRESLGKEQGHVLANGRRTKPVEYFVDILLHRDQQGKANAVLYHYPDGFPGLQPKGSVNVLVDPSAKRQGIATKLWEEAVQRWKIDPRTQEYTAEGRKFITSYLKKAKLRGAGGPGSGNYGHEGGEGGPGNPGGSRGGGGGKSPFKRSRVDRVVFNAGHTKIDLTSHDKPLYFSDKPRTTEFGKEVIKAYIDIQNPYVPGSAEDEEISLTEAEAKEIMGWGYDPADFGEETYVEALRAGLKDNMPFWQNRRYFTKIKEAGFDGVIATDNFGETAEYVVFDPKQIRALGGPGSGNFGHAGRPGEVGGSGPGGGSSKADAPARKAKALAPGVEKRTKTVTLYHSTSDEFTDNRPNFPAYYGTAEFQKAFPGEFGPRTYAIELPPNVPILNLDDTASPAVRKFMGEIAQSAFPDEEGLAALYEAGDADALEGFYEIWTDKSHTVKLLERYPHLAGARYHDEYILPVATLEKLKSSRFLGGPGSGNFGHAGRPGEVGGSASGSGLISDERIQEAGRHMDRSETEFYKFKEKLTTEFLIKTADNPVMQTEAEIEAELSRNPEYVKALDKWNEISQEYDILVEKYYAQEAERKGQENLAEVERRVEKVAEELGFDASLIELVNIESREFHVGDKQFLEAAHYNPATEMIQINARHTGGDPESMTRGVVAHEISHAFYHRLRQEQDREHEEMFALENTEGQRLFVGGLAQRGFALPEAQKEIMERWPVSAFFYKHFGDAYVETEEDQKPIPGVREGSRYAALSSMLQLEDGVSNYSTAYWNAAASKGYGYTDTERAVNETIAEMVRLLHVPESAAYSGPPKQVWVDFATDLLKLGKELK